MSEHPPSSTNYGALYEHIESSIDNLLVGAVPSSSIRVFLTQDHSTPAYIRNTSCYAASLVGQLTALSPWNSTGVYQMAGVLISPRHVLFATHYAPTAGTSLRFVTTENVVVSRVLSSIVAIPSIASLYPDFTVGLLDSDVPSSISFAKVLGAEAQAKLPDDWLTKPLPAITADQEEKLTVRDWINYAWSQGTNAAPCGFVQPGLPPYTENTPLRGPFYEGLVSGDSGSPSFVFINGQLVLLTVITGGGSGTGTAITPFITEINAAMTTLGGGYQLTPVDLSSFPDL